MQLPDADGPWLIGIAVALGQQTAAANAGQAVAAAATGMLYAGAAAAPFIVGAAFMAWGAWLAGRHNPAPRLAASAVQIP